MSGSCQVCGKPDRNIGIRQGDGGIFWYCFAHQPKQEPDPPPTLDFKLDVAPEEGMRRVMERSHDWGVRFRGYIRFMLKPGWIGIAETIRLMVEQTPIGPPPNGNMVGRAIAQAIADGLLVKTGRLAPMKVEEAHARQSHELRRTSLK